MFAIAGVLTRCAAMVLLATGVAIAQTPALPPIESLYGAYEVIGRTQTSGDPYRGWARLAVEGDVIEVDRCFDRVHTTGTGRIVRLANNDASAVEFEYNQAGRATKSTCVYTSDFDNLPRFTCYTYPADNPDIDVPGLESYFAIVWPVATDYFECQ